MRTRVRGRGVTVLLEVDELGAAGVELHMQLGLALAPGDLPLQPDAVGLLLDVPVRSNNNSCSLRFTLATPTPDSRGRAQSALSQELRRPSSTPPLLVRALQLVFRSIATHLMKTPPPSSQPGVSASSASGSPIWRSFNLQLPGQ